MIFQYFAEFAETSDVDKWTTKPVRVTVDNSHVPPLIFVNELNRPF